MGRHCSTAHQSLLIFSHKLWIYRIMCASFWIKKNSGISVVQQWVLHINTDIWTIFPLSSFITLIKAWWLLHLFTSLFFLVYLSSVPISPVLSIQGPCMQFNICITVTLKRTYSPLSQTFPLLTCQGGLGLICHANPVLFSPLSAPGEENSCFLEAVDALK